MQMKLLLTTFAVLALYANGCLAATTSRAPAPTPTGNCVGGCTTGIPPPAPNGLPANSLELFYLGWNNAYTVGEAIQFNFWMTNNPASSGKLPSSLDIHLYDEFGMTKLADIASQVSVPKTNGSSPFALSQWTVPETVNANFNTSNTYMIVFQGTDGWRADRRLVLDGVTAQPGGGPNPAYSNAVSASVIVHPNGTVTTNNNQKGQESSALSVLPSRFFFQCLWAIVVAQLVVLSML